LELEFNNINRHSTQGGFVSKGNQKTANLVIEWSPKGVTTFDAVTRSSQHFESAQAAAATTGSREVVAAVSRRSVFVRTTRVPDAGISDVRLVLSMKLGDLFPLAASDLAYDFVLTDDVDGEGRLAVVVAMAAQDLRRLHEEFKAAGYKVKQVIPSAFGSVALAESLSRTAGAIVTREADGIGIDIIEGKQLRYSRLSTNTANPTAEVCRTYTVAGLATAEIIASSGMHFADSDVSTPVSTLEALISSPHGLPEINLEVPEAVALRAKKAHDQRQAIAMFCFIGALGLSGFTYYDYNAKLAAVEDLKSRQTASLAKLTKQQKAQQAILATLISPRALGKLIGDKKLAATPFDGSSDDAQSAIDLGFNYGQKFSDVVTVVVNNVPPGLWINGISLERGKRLVLRGEAKTNEQVSAFVRSLSTQDQNTDQQRMRDVRLEFTNNSLIEQTPIVQFTVSAFPIGNVPLSDPTKVKQR
jgi:hypothetical protein